jgi:hypothetical protein
MKYQFENEKINRCEDCPCFMSVDFDYDMGYGTCQITFNRTSADGRPENCPLVEVKEKQNEKR